MSVGKASIARAVNAEKTAKTEEKVTEVKVTEKPTEVKTETGEKAAEKTGTVAQNVISGGNADELQAKFLTPKKEQPDNNQPVGIKDELPVYLL